VGGPGFQNLPLMEKNGRNKKIKKIIKKILKSLKKHLTNRYLCAIIKTTKERERGTKQ
jgi:hypothetical protein